MPLHVAARNFDFESVESLLHAGVDPNLQNKPGDAPLHIAAFYNGCRVVGV